MTTTRPARIGTTEPTPPKLKRGISASTHYGITINDLDPRHARRTSLGSTIGGLALLSILLLLTAQSARSQSLAEALDNTLSWTPGGAAGWYVQGSYTHDGLDAISSPGLGDNQDSWLETTVEGPGNLSFWWKVSSEFSYDFLTLSLDGQIVDTASGEVDWQLRSLAVGPGTHILRWRYAKDKAFAGGMDRAFLDQVQFITPAAVINQQPQGSHQAEGTVALLSVGATGDKLAYQWRRGSVNIPGATNSTLYYPKAQASQSGAYDVVVSNLYNSVTSQVALLDIYVPLQRPTRSPLMGTLAAWGPTPYGPLPADITNATAVVHAGNYMGAALKSDGTVAVWGYTGECLWCVPGDLTNAVALSAGQNHVVALREDGSVSVWGSGNYCQTCVPPGLSNIVAVAAGYFHTLALRDDGTVVGWGGNQWGQASAPSQLTDAIAISAGYGHSLALRRDGTVVAWGLNEQGQAVPPAGLTNVTSIEASPQGSTSYAITADATVRAWGRSDSGVTNIPSGLRNAIRLSAGADHCVALRSDGTLIAWGGGAPSIPTNINNVVDIAAADSGSLYGIITIPMMNPLDVTAAEGATASFTVVPSGPGQFTCQWSHNGFPIASATNLTLTLPNVSSLQAGAYVARVFSDRRSAVSRPAKLTVTASNDQFSRPALVQGGGGRFYGSTAQAGTELGEPNHLDAGGTHSIWYEWTAPANGTVVLDTIGSTFDTLLAVYSGSDFRTLRLLAADDDGAGFNQASRLSFGCSAGATYRIVIDGFLGAAGGVVLNVNPVLEILGESLVAGNALAISLFAPSGIPVVVEGSADLRNWSPVSTNVAGPDGILTLQTGTIQGPAKFYRGRVESRE